MATESTIIEELAIENIICDTTLQVRVKTNQNTVNDYVDDMKRGMEFPPLTVFKVGEGDTAQFFLVDGWHRLEACKQLHRQAVLVEVRHGSRRDALLYALEANATHGLPRSNADKRKVVDTFLCDDEWRDWSDEKIAKHAGVTSHTVGNRRRHLENKGIIPKSTERKFTRNQQTSTMQTANLSGRKKSLRQTEETPAPSVPLEEPNESEHGEIPLVSTASPLEVEESAIASESPDDLQHETQQVCTRESDNTSKPVPEAEQQEHSALDELPPDHPDAFLQVESIHILVKGIDQEVKHYRDLRLTQTGISTIDQKVLQIFEKALSEAQELLKPHPLPSP